MALTKTQVSELYVAIFNRASEGTGNTYWQGEGSAAEVAQKMLDTVDAKEYFGTAIDDDKAFIEHIYINTLGKTYAEDAEGIDFWVARLANGESRGEVVAALVAAARDPQYAGTPAQQQFLNRVEVSDYAAENIQNVPENYKQTLGFSGDLTVTSNPDTISPAKKAVQELAVETDGGSKGETFSLTTGVDTIPAEGQDNSGDDTIEGVVSALTAENTLNALDQIDGGEGNDTLKADLQSNFTGFTGTGKLANVENIELTNSGTIGRNFDATGVTGAQKYVLNAGESSISLSNLAAAGIAVDVVGQKSGTATVGFTTKAVEGTADALTVGVNGVGTAEVKDASGAVTTAAKYVAVTATGIENLTVNATGANLVNLAGAATKTITAAGEGSLNVEAVGTVTSFDASGVKGAVTANLIGAATGTLATVKGGEGDDVVTVDLADLTANATISGGAGANTLKVSGTGTIQPTLSQFQTVELNGITGDSTISAKNVSDLATLAIKGTTALANTVTVAGLNSAALTVQTEGAQGGVVQLTSPTVLTYNTTSTAANTTAKTQQTVATAITANEATNATINVGAYTTQTGAISLNKATAVTLNVATGKSADATPVERTSFDANLTANAAQSVVINADGVLGASAGRTLTAGAATLLDVTATGGGDMAFATVKAQQVNIKAGAALDIQGSTFNAAEQVNIAANVGHVDGTGVALGKISTLNLSGTGTATGKESKVTLGNLGSADLTNAIAVTATGLKGGVNLGTINSNAANVTVTATEATGAVVVNAIGGLKDVGNVTVNASTLGSTDVGTINTVKGATVQINATGLLGKDTSGYALKVGAVTVADDGTAKSGTINATISGSNDLDIGALSAKTVTLDLSGYLGGDIDGTGTGTVAKVADVTGQNVTIKGSELGANTLTSNVILAAGQTSTLAVTGGLQGDTLNVKGVITSNDAATISFTGGDGTDTIVFADDADLTATNSKLTLSGVENIDVTAAKAVVVKAADLSGAEITVVNNTTGTLTLKGTDAADTIDTSKFLSGTVTIEGGKGNDTIKLGAAVETVKFSAVADNGADTITGFTAASDSLDFTTFLGGAASVETTAVDASTAKLDLSTKNVGVLFNDADASIASGDIATDTSQLVQVADNGKAVVLVTDAATANAATKYSVYYVEDTDTTAAVSYEVTLVGTVELSTAADIAAGTFV